MSGPEALKACCADLYASKAARLLLGDSLHPGGDALTERLGLLLDLRSDSRVLDVAAGPGGSPRCVARRFGCRVVGVDYSRVSAAAARHSGVGAGLGGRLAFLSGDAERLPLTGGSFDAALCECAFCTFPNKRVAAAELARVVRPGGAVGLADLVRRGPLPAGLDSLLAWVACVADARPHEEYVDHLEAVGFRVATIEDHDGALVELVRRVRLRLAAVRAAAQLRQVALPGVDLVRAAGLARTAELAVREGALGYSLIVAGRSR